jgi:acetoin utilization protein AcuB
MTIIRVTIKYFKPFMENPMNVASIMTRKVVTVEKDDHLWTIREIFENVKFHHILVVDDRKLVGVISDRDFLNAISPFLDMLSENICDSRKAHEIMSRKLITVDAETSIEKASDLLLENNISCLPVISPQGSVEGIVSWKDILKFYSKNQTVTV